MIARVSSLLRAPRMNLGWIALLGGATSCSEQPSAATQVIVLVGGEIGIRHLEVRIYDVAGEEVSGNLQIDLTRRDPPRLPTSFTVIPRTTNPADRFRMTVQAFDLSPEGKKRARAQHEVIATFSNGRTTLLPMVLGTSCANERCGCSEGGLCARTCTPDPDAVGGAVCTPVPTYDDLPDVVPGNELEALKDGTEACPRGTVPSVDGSCEDLDECAFVIDSCQVAPRACVNLAPAAGRYECVCPPGYSGVGDEDEPCIEGGSP